MDSVLYFVILFVFFMLVYVLAIIIRKAQWKNKIGIYQRYIAAQFPLIPKEEPLLVATQISQKLTPTIAITLDQSNRSVILFFENGKQAVTHKIYPYSSLTEVYRMPRIFSRKTGLFTKIHGYEETLLLSFNDGSKYPFIASSISNKYGTDKGADVVRNIFNPWEQKLRGMIQPPPPPPPAVN
jgi:hypothetical protein